MSEALKNIKQRLQRRNPGATTITLPVSDVEELVRMAGDTTPLPPLPPLDGSKLSFLDHSKGGGKPGRKSKRGAWGPLRPPDPELDSGVG